MKWSFAGVAVIVAGLIGLAIYMLFQDITTKNEQDYYLLKEITEAAMVESVDKDYMEYTGELKIIKQKFIENFTRRFAETANFSTGGYKLEFYDIIEIPPKVSVKVISKSNTITVNSDSSEFDIVNQLDAILEYEVVNK